MPEIFIMRLVNNSANGFVLSNNHQVAHAWQGSVLCSYDANQVCRTQGSVLCSYDASQVADRRGRSCAVTMPVKSPIAGAGLVPALNNVLTSFKNMSNIVCGPAQDRPLRCVSNLPNLNSLQRFCFVLLPIFDGI